MKKSIICVLLAVFLLSIGLSVASAADGPTEITFVIWGDDARKKGYEELFAPFEAENNIKVNVTLVALEEIVTKVSTQIASGTSPDVVWMTESMLPQFIKTKNLEDISPIMEDEAYDFGDLFQSVVANYIVDGKLYAVPFTTSPRVWFYNKNMVAEAGLEDPLELAKKGEWTMDKMLDYARAMTNKEKGTYGFTIMNYQSPNDWNILLDWTWGNGASFFDKDMTKCTINTPEGIESLQLYSDCIFKEGLQPLPGEQIDFASGKIGLTRNVISFSGQLKDVDFDWDIIPNPTGKDKNAPVAVGVAAYVVPKGAKHIEESMKVIKYITSKEMMGSEFLMPRFSPLRSSVISSDAFLTMGGDRPSPEAKKVAILEPLNHETRLYPVCDNYQEADLKMKELMDMIYTQSAPIEEITATMETELNAILAQ